MSAVRAGITTGQPCKACGKYRVLYYNVHTEWWICKDCATKLRKIRQVHHTKFIRRTWTNA